MQADSLPIRGGNQDLLYRPLGKIRLWASTCKQERPLYLRLSTKTGKSYGIDYRGRKPGMENCHVMPIIFLL